MGLCTSCNAPVDEGVEKCANCAGAPAEAPMEAPEAPEAAPEAPAEAPAEGGDEAAE